MILKLMPLSLYTIDNIHEVTCVKTYNVRAKMGFFAT